MRGKTPGRDCPSLTNLLFRTIPADCRSVELGGSCFYFERASGSGSCQKVHIMGIPDPSFYAQKLHLLVYSTLVVIRRVSKGGISKPSRMNLEMQKTLSKRMETMVISRIDDLPDFLDRLGLTKENAEWRTSLCRNGGALALPHAKDPRCPSQMTLFKTIGGGLSVKRTVRSDAPQCDSIDVRPFDDQKRGVAYCLKLMNDFGGDWHFRWLELLNPNIPNSGLMNHRKMLRSR